ncbi:Exodeoxyribonuclease V alpha chain,exonuclease V subunit alpha,exodeoxyribonuclease V, alpha subunit,Viral (Superfamily 1) RNA helicase [Chlamydia poikilotherma]|uniref:Exodeoxyribonuclease V alpha chain,exonuclease V subunit alpha,exodeoxyribonuclease V, alpha subunit,Viral (Superfamily 1) RNA helicase n=1 Tax=Chlamydia poikilotherma TaxID=1967783 RepID=A0A3B0Q1S8_9CHLA|nr:exodeoxyribonuclease V subunit alpha [Chlamydia poikilotherma]SYX09465.1 Exodeoxyribonuclease V alpha chain,exonuclease V subunit alpha,exodeoxyribonuclease V, alpha subunit,Viral (Superfamily 1) RNA helicase [Chlamydia poikilotherma]
MPSLSLDVSHLLYNVVQQQLVLPLDLAFAKKYISPNSKKGFAFLALSSALWRCGYPFLNIDKDRLFPSLSGISEKIFYEYFTALPEDICSSLFVIENNRIYLRSLYAIREKLFKKLSVLSQASPRYNVTTEFLPNLSSEQNTVFQKAINSCFSLICGGPGTGKTFLAVEIILTLIKRCPRSRIAIVSPTGKATSHIRHILSQHNISEDNVTTQTIHRFLQEHAYHQCSSVDLLLVDEGSMVTFNLLHSLVNTLSGENKNGKIIADNLIILGDENQLPPIGVGAGNPLQDLILRFPERALHLCVSHRAKTDQVQNFSKAILEKQSIPFTPLPPIHSAITMIKEAFVKTPLSQTQLCILTPMRHGPWGYLRLNELIFNEIQKTHSDLPIPIMITERYEAWGLFNGDTGFLCPKTQQLFFPHTRSIDSKEFSYYTYNYAMSVHKSQGSEYDNVIVIIPKGGEIFDVSILYTAITRAKHDVSVWADSDTLNKIIKKPHKYTYGVE